MTRFRIYEAYFRLGFGCMWRFYRAVPCRRPRLMKGHIVMGATALVTYLGAGRRALVPPPAHMESAQIAVIEMIVPVILILSKIISEPKGILVDVIGITSCHTVY